EMSITFDQVVPWSVERITDSWNWFGDDCAPDPLRSSKMSTSVPSGSTTIWLPTVNSFWFRPRMSRGASQVWPPFVVREKVMSPRIDAAFICPVRSALSLGKRLRSQTAYTLFAFVGSAVIDSLSLKPGPSGKLATLRASVVGSLQVSPPSTDLPTRTADRVRSALAERLIWYASPFGANVSPGSGARP